MWLPSLRLILVVYTFTGHAVGAADDQDAEESSWSSYGWADSWYHDTPEPAPLDRPRQRHLGVGEAEVDAAPLYVVWEELPLLAKEGVTSEEARWVPERAPLRIIKESYTSGSREFDHSFLKSPRGSLAFVDHHETPVYVPEAPHAPEIHPHVPEPPPQVHEAPHVPEHVPDVQPHVLEAPHKPEPPVYVPTSPPVTKAYPGPPKPPPPQYSVHPGQPRKYYLTEDGQQEHRRVPGLRQYYLLDAQGGGGHPQEELPLELPPVTENEIRLQEHLSEVGPPAHPSHPLTLPILLLLHPLHLPTLPTNPTTLPLPFPP
nr:splicing factor 3A subunit 2-like [Penaeus vannamei]